MAFFRDPKKAAKLLNAKTLAIEPVKTAATTLRWSLMGNQIVLPLNAYLASKAAPGEALSVFTAETLGFGTHAVLSVATSSLLHIIPGFSMIPLGGRATIAAFVAALPNIAVIDKMQRGLSLLSSSDRRIQRLEMGGDFQDSETAAALRMAAVRDMSSAMGMRRRYLGAEALYFHA